MQTLACLVNCMPAATPDMAVKHACARLPYYALTLPDRRELRTLARATLGHRSGIRGATRMRYAGCRRRLNTDEPTTMFSLFSSSRPEDLLVHLLTLASPTAVLLVLIIGFVLLLMAPASSERRLGLWGLFFILLNWLGSIATGLLQTTLMLRLENFSQALLLGKWSFLILYLVNAIGMGLLVLALARRLRAPQTKCELPAASSTSHRS